jgi:transcriptional regulator with XRE-family HTH domain
MTDFAQALKAARAATGLSQQGMADRMLIPKRTIEKWETGERTPPPYVQRFVLNELESLKDEEAERPCGEWIKQANRITCSDCFFIYYNNKADYNYCPKCGAKMRD